MLPNFEHWIEKVLFYREFFPLQASICKGFCVFPLRCFGLFCNLNYLQIRFFTADLSPFYSQINVEEDALTGNLSPLKVWNLKSQNARIGSGSGWAYLKKPIANVNQL